MAINRPWEGAGRFPVISGVHILILTVIFTFLMNSTHGLIFTKTEQTYAKFPKWDACPNSSFSFEFKTTQSKALLMYADDSGKYDYIEVMIIDTKVRLRMNIVDGVDGVVEVSLGTRLNDNRWHRVEIQRNRMESRLIVDGLQGRSVAFGSDFKFGDINRNSYVYFGGIPNEHRSSMSLPSSNYEPRFEGEIRNVIYWNCTCMPVRGKLIEGKGVSFNENEACDTRSTCSSDCLCIDRDEGPGCQCLGFNCQTGEDTHYYLPMETITGFTLDNPSGLDAKVIGNPEKVTGVMGSALKIDCQTSKVKVSGPGHRQECFGDLDLCPNGYTVGLWVKFDKPEPGNAVYLSNGGQTTESHGISMTYQVGKLRWAFRTKDGKEWHVSANNILPRHWYHVLVTWKATNGLTLFINGDKISSEEIPTVRAPTFNGQSQFNDFIIGQSNDETGISDLGIMTIDEFNFWSYEMADKQLREMGPIYKYHLSMDQFQNGKLVTPNLEPRTVGLLREIPGKIGQAAYFPGSGQYVDLGPLYDTCIGNTSQCMYGFMVSFWIKFYQIGNDTYNYYITSGVNGFSIYSYADRIYTTVQMDDRQWRTFTSGLLNGEWYFIEVSWSKQNGLSLYIDQNLKMTQSSSNHNAVTLNTRHDNFYIGRDNNYRYTGSHAFAIDDLEIFNANREKLMNIDFIQREKPTKTYYSFDNTAGTDIQERSTVIQTYGRPSLVPGKIGRALMLTGKIQVAQFDHGDGCLGNLDYCIHGVLLSLWFRPEEFKEGMFYLSSGINGITFSYVDRKFRVSAMTSPLKWEVTSEDLQTGHWYFLETSWGPDSGLQLYADGHLIAEDKYPKDNIETEDVTKLLYDKFVFGKENSDKAGSLYGAAIYDEMEFWYGTRDYLLAFNYIQRGIPTHYRLTMDKMTSDKKSLSHSSLPVRLFGSPDLVPGKINKAIRLSGDTQFIDLGAPKDSCLGNINLCHFGKYISMWMKINEYDYNMYLLSTGRNGIRMYYVSGYIYVTADNNNKSWRLSVPRLLLGQWHFLELSWHPEFGLELLVDGEKAETQNYRQIPSADGSSGNFYIGGPNFGDTSGQTFSYAKMDVDEVEVWFARRDELLAFGYILGDTVEYESFSMETARGDVIYHPRYRLTLERGASLVPGRVGNAVSLSGSGQYVDLGKHTDECLGNLDLCNNGITLSMDLKPRNLKDKSYFLSSPSYSLYYEDRQLKSKFKSEGKEWTVASKYFRQNEWNNVMLSWEPTDGLQILVNNTLIDSDVTPVDVMQADESDDGNVLLGKTSDDDVDTTADAQMDEIQIWYANLEKLRAKGLLKAPIHETLPFYELRKDGVLKLPSRKITVFGGVDMVQGEHRRAIKLDGKRQYIDLGENLTCSGNLDNCHYGFTMRFSTKPTKLGNNMYFLDSYPITIFYRDGKLYCTVRTSSKTWTVAAPGFKAGEWQVVDVSWHPEVGLTLHVNDEESGAQKTYGTDKMPVFNYDRKTYFGRALTKMVDERYAATALENFEVWNVRRDVLISDDKLLDQGSEFIIGTEVNIDSNSNPKPDKPVPTQPPTVKPTTDKSVSNDESTVRRVFVTSLPDGSTQLVGEGFLNGRLSGLSKIIRFFGKSRVGYNYAVLPKEMMDPSDEESFALKFITKKPDGLLWIFKGSDGSNFHISLKDGNIQYVHTQGRRLLQEQIIQAKRPLNDFRWHNFTITKANDRLNFVIDDDIASLLVNETYRAAPGLQFVKPGNADLGGTFEVAQSTNNKVTSNFDGAITDVVVKKLIAPNKEMIVRFLQQVDDEVRRTNTVWDFEDFIRGDYTWDPKPKEIKSPVTFTTGNSVFYLKDALDFRDEGSVAFRFRTLEPRGLLAFARGSASSVNFFALEIFDGQLYLVYNFGGFRGRKPFPADSRVDDGEWHDVSLVVDGSLITVTLDNQRLTVGLTSTQKSILYFYRLYIGGYDEFNRIPWAIYSRMGYKGCVESLRVNDIPVDLHSRFSDINIRGVEQGCNSQGRSCLRQPCTSGFCQDRMGTYMCDCSSTPYTGQNCDIDAVIASWDGTKPTIYKLQPLAQDTHTNDISFRFLTPLNNTLLFSTESQNRRDYMRAEVINGKVVVTFNVGGRLKTFELDQIVNDYRWHTLYIKRRADDVEAWVDDNPRLSGMIGGTNYVLNIDNIRFGSLGATSSLSSNNYIGYMQNFIYDDKEILGELKQRKNTNVIWITGVNWENVPLITYKPVTVSTSDAHFQLPSLQRSLSLKLMFKFKTREPSGLMLYSSGLGKDVIAIEMTNGALRLAYNLGSKNMFTMGPSRKQLNDNQWHSVMVSLTEDGRLNLNVDGDTTAVSNIDGDSQLDLYGKLYIGGIPKEMFNRPGIRSLIKSRQGFRGCFASMDLNGAVPELLNYATDKQQIFSGCSDLMMTCKPDACGTGMCMPGLDSFWCDCNMTGYVGDFCQESFLDVTDDNRYVRDFCKPFPVGYYFGKDGGDGLMIYEFPYTTNSDLDQIAFGFMTRQEDAVLYRIVGNVGNEFIEIRLENGHVVAESNTGGGVVLLKEMSQKFNDGEYHVVRYIRTGSNSTLQVNQLNTQYAAHSGVASLFDKVYMVILGGRMDGQGVQSMHYNGIMGGAYYNGYRWMDARKEGILINGQSVRVDGSVVISKPFILVESKPPTPTPPPIFIPPDAEIPDDLGGGGATIGGVGTGGDPVIGIGGPGGDVTVFNGGTGINVPGAGGETPLASAMVGPAPPPMATGARAGAVVGTVLGTMAFMSSLMWALYKLKPGVPAFMSPGAGSAGAGSGAGAGGMSISSPRTTSNLGAVQAASAGGGSGGAAGSGSAASATKVTVVNGSASGGGGGGAGAGNTTYTSYFQSTSTSVGGGGQSGGGGAGYAGTYGGSSSSANHFDSATLRATGTFSNKGTAIGSPTGGRAHLGSSTSGYSANYQSNTMQSYSSDMGGGSAFDRQHFVSSSSAGQDIPDYDMPVSGTLQSGQSYSSSTLNTHYNYQVTGAHSNTSVLSHTNTSTITLNSSSNQSHTSILNLLVSKSNTLTPVNHQAYTPALGPCLSDGQVFVDRSEDLVIEECPATLTVNRANRNGIETTAEVQLQTNSGMASYRSNHGIASTEFTMNTNEYMELESEVNSSREHLTKESQKAKSRTSGISFPKLDIFSKNRKASLQVNSESTEFQIRKGGYERMDIHSSEADIAESSFSTLPSASKRSGCVSKQKAVDLSQDNLYESTTTITSTVRSDSMGQSLECIMDGEAEERNSSARLDLLMASLEDFNKMSALKMDDLKTTPSFENNIYATVDKSRQGREVKHESTEVNRNASYTVTCSAQIKGDCSEEKSSSLSSSNSSSSSSKSSSKSNSRSQSPPNVQHQMSFDDTLAQFQNFVVEIDGNPLPATGTVLEDRQTERGEHVIQVDKPTFSRKRQENSQHETSMTSHQVKTDTSQHVMTSSLTHEVSQSNMQTISINLNTESNGTYSENQCNLDQELNDSVHALLTGINMDTAGWSAIKDVNKPDDLPIDMMTYEVQNVKTVSMNRQGQYVLTSGGFSSGAVTPGAAADEVRVDCCLITKDGRYVVTGSSSGPPQVWDMQTGELQTIMKGDTVGSTSLNLLYGDKLMVGAVHCDKEINEYSSRKGVFNHTLQMWDFQSGRPMALGGGDGEYCSVLCPMSDDDKVIFGRTDKFGDATSIIVWDLMGNEAIKEMRYDAPVGNNDYINFLKLSKNDRYVVAGFTNSFDNCMEFMVFDMSLTSRAISDPQMLKLDANPECTVILPKDEAVTGLRNGDLVIWNIRTGQPSRQLLGSGGAHAHSREVKAVSLSEDGRYLVSASADGTLKVWDLHTERPLHTLAGHADEVWCCGISVDNEIIVSGSSDGTIRLWRMKNGTEMCVFNCGVDIFHVIMSRDKGTIVALGDKYGARKLIMLQVVRTKIKKIVSS